jgi:DNA-binding NarL/FixJ family response regulator
MNDVLIIEDDVFKANSIIELINTSRKYGSILHVSSLVEAVDAVNQDEYGLIMIDMSIPSHPIVAGGGSPISLLTGGLEVLLEISSVENQSPCVVITQYPDIEISGEFYTLAQAKEEIKNQLGCDVLACIKYVEGCENWKTELKEVLKIK